MKTLAVVETHPVQYHAPVYRCVESRFGVPVTAVYGSDFSVAGYRDVEFGASFRWDADLLSGYTPRFLSRVSEGGASSAEGVTARGLGAELERCAPGAVLLTGYASRFYWNAFCRARERKAPILFRAETNDAARARNFAKAGLRDAFLRWFYGRCSRLLYIGKRSLEHYRRLGVDEGKLVFSPYCVDIAPFRCGEPDRLILRAEGRAELGIAEDRFAVIFSGKLSPRKGVDLLVEAARLLPEEVRRRLVLVFLGDGEMREELRSRAAAAGVEARFIGFKNQTELSRYYHAADILVLPSRWGETWGLVVNEALHHGIPAVVSDAVGCAPDLIESGRTGEVFSSGSALSLAGALKKTLTLAGDPAVREACRKKAAGYTVERAARGIFSAFESIASREVSR